MRATEFVTETMTSPYKMNYRNSVTWRTSNRRKTHGVAADFTTDAGVVYNMRAFTLGRTKAERDEEKRIADKGELDMSMVFDSRYGGMWEVHFHSFDGSDEETRTAKDVLTGTGDEFRVFATVLEFIKRIVQDYHPMIISIKSRDSESGRFELYKKLANRFAPKLGYEVGKAVSSGTKTRMELKRIDKSV